VFTESEVLRGASTKRRQSMGEMVIQCTITGMNHMLTVVETPEFMDWCASVWSDEERSEFINWIAANPHAGDAIPGSGGLRSVVCHS